MTTTTFTDNDMLFNRFDQPLLGVASDAVHLVYFWPMTSLGFIDPLNPPPWPEGFKREMLKKQRGRCPWTDCNDPLDLNDKLEVDHVWPISKGGRNWILNLQLLHKRCNIEKSDRIDFAVNNISPLLPHLVVLIRWLSKHPRLAALIVGGIALIIAISIVVKWLRKYVDGVRRYALWSRSARDSLARNASRLSGDLEGICRFARKARRVAGQTGRESTHRLATTAGEMLGRVGSAATNVRDTSSEGLREPAGLAVRSARRAGGTLGGSAWTAVTRVKSGASHAPGLVQSQAGRVAGLLPRPRRKTQPAFALST